jgi:hypothetical protein
MKIVTDHKIWWLLIILATGMVSAATSYHITVGGIVSSMVGHLVFSIGVAMVPWVFYRVIGKPLTTEQMMATITVGWLILAIANLSV